MSPLRLKLPALLAVTGCATGTYNEQAAPFERLDAGNQRFVSGHARHPHASAAVRHDTTVHGQHPFATVVACSDSRVPVEMIFDQGIGDLFVIRVAGNVIDTDETGSVEYAIEHLKTPLLVILGHVQCGAVTAAVQHSEDTPSIMALLDHIGPAVDKAQTYVGNSDSQALVAAAVRENARKGVDDVLARSAIAREMVADGQLAIVPAVYDIDSGKVEWLAEPPALSGAPAETHDGGTH